MPLGTRLRRLLARVTPPDSPSSAPRFVVRVVVISFATVVGVLGAICVVLVFETRAVVERGIASDLAAAQRQLAVSQRDRQRDAFLRASLISSSPTVQTVLEAYQEQRAFGVDAVARHELGCPAASRSIASRRCSRPMAWPSSASTAASSSAAVRSAPGWPAGTVLLRIADAGTVDSDQVITLGAACYRATVAPIAAADGVRLAFLVEGRRPRSTLRRRPRR